jgi:DNA helicase INO80
MIDILEEYMAKRRYSYFRMDGSTNIADRRDMVNEFQTNSQIFAFLLSTRAGGLGVNLTGADTVIFYDNDWNPTMDAQATDRAHRIGQTRPVGVYRLTTKDTIEERILKRAKQKQNVQTTVYAGGAFKADIFKQSEIVELLYSEEEVKKLESERKKHIEANANQMFIDSGKNMEIVIADGVIVKEAKSKNKGGKKNANVQEKSSKSKKAQGNKEDENKEDGNTGEAIKKENAQKSIFSVSIGAAKKNIFNTLRCNS